MTRLQGKCIKYKFRVYTQSVLNILRSPGGDYWFGLCNILYMRFTQNNGSQSVFRGTLRFNRNGFAGCTWLLRKLFCIIFGLFEILTGRLATVAVTELDGTVLYYCFED